MSKMSQIEIFDNEAASEEVITEKPTHTGVEEERRREQKRREMASCGRLRLDAPGATEDDRMTIGDLLGDAFAKLHSGGSSVTIDPDSIRDSLYTAPEKKQSDSQRREIHEQLGIFTSEYEETVRQALVDAMLRENWDGQATDSWQPQKGWFRTLSEWDFNVKCEDCGGEVRSNALYINPRRARPEKKKTFTSMQCYHCGHDNDKIRKHRPSPDGTGSFHWVVEQVLESLLVQSCSTRYVPGTEYKVLLGGDEVPIWIKVSESGNMRQVKHGISENRYIRVQAREMTDILSLVRAANQNRPSGTDPICLEDTEGNKLPIGHSSEVAASGVFYARGTAILEDLARRLRSLREDDAGAEELRKDGWGDSNLDSWSTNMAGRILYEVSDSPDTPESIVNGICAFHKPSNARDEGWMIEFSEGVTAFIDENLDEDMLSNFYNRDTVPPMICRPDDWELDDELLAKGGFTTSHMQSRMPIVPREVTHKRLGQSRIILTKESLEPLNRSQNVAFRVNRKMLEVERQVMHQRVTDCASASVRLRRFEPKHTKSELEGMKVEDLENLLKERGLPYSGDDVRKQELVERLSNPYYVLEQYGDRLLHPSSQSFTEWTKELDYAEALLEDPVAEGRFFHSYRMDHRGRMYTASTLLDPQGDDVSRGLIEFDSSFPLDEEGWKNLSIGVAKAWEGTGAPGAPEKRSTFSELLSASKDPEFRNTLSEAAENPMATLEVWGAPGGKSDLMKSHAEGFQRMATTMAFVSALDEGGIGAQSRHVQVQDASSNIYQHMATLLLDREMADKVNVLPAQPGQGPRDVYSEIGMVVGGDDDFLDYMEKFGIDRKDAESIRQVVSARAFAKSPVMVLGYGAGKDAISQKYLTNNGKSRKEGGRVEWHHIMEDEEYFRIFESSLEEACKTVSDLESVRSNILESIPENRHYKSSWKRATKDMIREALELDESNRLELNSEDLGFLEANHEDGTKDILDLFDSLTSDPICMCAHRESLMAEALEGRVPKELQMRVAMLTADAYLRAIKEVLPNYDRLKKELRKIVRNSGDYPFFWNPGVDGLIVNHLALKKPSYQPITRWQAQEEQGKGTLTRRRYSKTRDHRAELMSIAPNFVHSIDAAHMRAVAVGLTDAQIEAEAPIQFWMVHDAFGTHPNFVGAMRSLVWDKLLEIYGELVIDEAILSHQALSVGKKLLDLRDCETLGPSSVEAAAGEFMVDPSDGVFQNDPTKSIRERGRSAAEHLGLDMEVHEALSEADLEARFHPKNISNERMQKVCKERELVQKSPAKGKGVHRAALLDRLSVETIIIKPKDGSAIKEIFDDTEHEYNQKAKVAVQAMRVLMRLDPLFRESEDVEAKNNFEFLYLLREGSKFFTTDTKAKGVGTLDLNDLPSSGSTDEWYFLS